MVVINIALIILNELFCVFNEYFSAVNTVKHHNVWMGLLSVDGSWTVISLLICTYGKWVYVRNYVQAVFLLSHRSIINIFHMWPFMMIIAQNMNNNKILVMMIMTMVAVIKLCENYCYKFWFITLEKCLSNRWFHSTLLVDDDVF